MKEIYAHEYTVTAMKPEKMGVRSIIIHVVDDKNNPDHAIEEGMKAVEMATKFFDQDLNISHRVLLQGYSNE